MNIEFASEFLHWLAGYMSACEDSKQDNISIKTVRKALYDYKSSYAVKQKQLLTDIVYNGTDLHKGYTTTTSTATEPIRTVVPGVYDDSEEI